MSITDRITAAIARRDAKLSQELLAELPDKLPRNVFELADSWLTEKELGIANLPDATYLSREISDGSLTAVEVMQAVGKRAVHAQQLTNCLTDLFLPQALARAAELDAHFARTGQTVGPLHGVPVSIKDQVRYKGRVSAIGWLAYDERGEVAEETALLARILEEAGAIIYCHTSLPQAIMQLETHCYLGVTKNPHDLEASPGGSSGGESALIAMKGSFMGVGTDIGGSVRSPAMACGIYALKPTSYRVPAAGFLGSTPGAEAIVSVAGPMTRSARDIDLFMSVLDAAKPSLRDPMIHPIPWRTLNPKNLYSAQRPLRVGYYTCDGVVQVHPPVKRGIQHVLDKLKGRNDVVLKEFNPVGHGAMSALVHELYFADNGKRMRDLAAASGEPIVPLTEWVISKPEVKDHNLHELWDICAKRNAFRASYAEHWAESEVNVVICPAGPGTAPRHGTSGIWWGYTNVWNLLDYPATVFPIGLDADPKIDVADEAFLPLSEYDSQYHALYDPKSEIGHPLTVQVVGYHHLDDEVVAATQFIEAAIRGD